MESKDRLAGFSSTARHLVIVACLVVIVAGMRAASSMLGPLLMAAFFAATFTVPLTWLQRKAIPRKLAMGLVAGGILVFGSLLALLLALSVEGLLADLPTYQERLSTLTTSAIDWLNTRGVIVSGAELRRHFDLGQVMTFIGGVLPGLGSVLAGAFLVLLSLVFILLEAPGFPRKLRTALRDPEESLSGLMEISLTAQKYLLIKTLVGAAGGTVIGIWLWILGVKYAFLWGFLSFLFNFVPYVGGYIASIPALLLALADRGAVPALLALLGYLNVSLVFGSFVEPRLMATRFHLSPFVVLVSLMIWGWALGPVGMILSVPLTVVLRIAFEKRDGTRWIAILLAAEAHEDTS